MSQATVLVLFLVAGFALAPPPPIAVLAATGFAGMCFGCLTYAAASWLVAPSWATDRALAAGADAVAAAVALQALGGGGAWAFEGDKKKEAVRSPLPAEPDADAVPPPILAAGGELSVPRPPACLRRRRRRRWGRRGGDLEAGPVPSTSTSTAPPAPSPSTSPAAAWARVHGALAQAAQWREAARGEGCLGVVRVRKRFWRLLFPQLPLVSSVCTHFPTAAVVTLADATAAHARLAWTLASLVAGGGGGSASLGGPAGEAVLECYGREALAAVGAAAAAVGAAIVAAVPRRYEPVGESADARVAAPELETLEEAVGVLLTLHDAGAGAATASVRGGKKKEKDTDGDRGATLAALMAAAAAEDATFLDEVRFAAWQSGLAPLVGSLRRVAGAVEGLRLAMPQA